MIIVMLILINMVVIYDNGEILHYGIIIIIIRTLVVHKQKELLVLVMVQNGYVIHID